MASPIRRLLNLITDAVDTLEAACDASGCTPPDLHTPFTPASEAFRANPAAAEAANIISAAALQLEAILTPPHASLYRVVFGHLKSAAVRVCLESNVTEILREAGPEGLHVNDIAFKNGQDPRKLARFLRYLATHHIYRELKPDVFTNNRISSMMDTHKSSQDVIEHPESKHDNTPGLAALVAHHLDETFKASAYAWETLADPATAKSGEPAASPFSKAFNGKETAWDLFSEDKSRARRFNIGMQGIQALQPKDAILKSYDWNDLLAGSVVVDVGGGVGTSSLRLAQEFPSLHFVVEDQASVVEQAKNLWKTEMPNAKVTLQVQDFFQPQPTGRHVSVFLLKSVLHDWPDKYCAKILSQLRTAASPDTKLVLVESLIPFACRDPSGQGENKGIPGSIPREAPEPLLANYGAVNEMGYGIDIAMFISFNAQERTVHHITALLLSTGWKVTMVRRQKGDNIFLQAVEAVPIEVSGA